MDLKQKYRWQKQSNGNFSIWNLPIFALFSDKEKGSISKEDAETIVENFNKDRVAGYYPRVHLEHQNGDGSRPGCGFLDDLIFDGEKFFADLVEIPESVFEDIQKLKYPYRSVEFHPDRLKILSLALLESQPSFFQFPLLALENEPSEDNIKKFSFERRLSFSLKSCNCNENNEDDMDEENDEKDKVEKFQDEENDEKKKDVHVDIDSHQDEDEEEPASEEKTGLDAVMEKMDAILAGINEMKSFHRMLLEKNDENVPGSEQTPPGAGDVGQQPQTAQQMQKFQEISERLNRLENHKKLSFSLSRLKKICAENNSIDYEKEKKVVMQFSSEKDQAVYMNALESRENHSKHVATQMLERKGLQSFCQGNQVLEKEAQSAMKDYQDTVSQSNQREVNRFKALWPKAEDWIKFRIEKKKIEMNLNN